MYVHPYVCLCACGFQSWLRFHHTCCWSPHQPSQPAHLLSINSSTCSIKNATFPIMPCQTVGFPSVVHQPPGVFFVPALVSWWILLCLTSFCSFFFFFALKNIQASPAANHLRSAHHTTTCPPPLICLAVSRLLSPAPCEHPLPSPSFGFKKNLVSKLFSHHFALSLSFSLSPFFLFVFSAAALKGLKIQINWKNCITIEASPERTRKTMRHGEKQQLNERQFDDRDLLSCTKLIKINLSVEHIL